MDTRHPALNSCKVLCAVASIVTAITPSAATADIRDLTTARTATIINSARFETTDFRTAGTGFIRSFVRLRATGIEEGYNTSGRPVPFDEMTDQNFTRDMRLSELVIRTVGGVDYLEFLLDINESAAGVEPRVSLDQVRIFTSSVGGSTTDTISQLGTLRYNMDLDENNTVLLNYRLNSGSGQGDMRLLVPEAAFASAGANDYVYLYSAFGGMNRSNAGFEEWAAPSSVPAPASLALLVGVATLAWRRRDSATK